MHPWLDAIVVAFISIAKPPGAAEKEETERVPRNNPSEPSSRKKSDDGHDKGGGGEATANGGGGAATRDGTANITQPEADDESLGATFARVMAGGDIEDEGQPGKGATRQLQCEFATPTAGEQERRQDTVGPPGTALASPMATPMHKRPIYSTHSSL